MATLSIVGCSQSMFSYVLAYMADRKPPTTRTWVINRMALVLQQADMCVAMDDRRWMQRQKQYRGVAKKIDSVGMPVMTSKVYPEYPNSVEYPLSYVLERVSCGNVLKNSVNFALALGIARRFKAITLWGCDFSPNDEYGTVKLYQETTPRWRAYYTEEGQRPTSEPGLEQTTWLMGLAEERGIDVRLPLNATLLERDRPHYLYGYMENPLFPDTTNET
tara:strand:- start:14655 stop:15311 length:657 start_codon:yes stop_codon:yes gene_type:complete